MIFTDDVERLIHLGGRDDLEVVLFHLYRQALRETFISNEDIADTVFLLVDDTYDQVNDCADGAEPTR